MNTLDDLLRKHYYRFECRRDDYLVVAVIRRFAGICSQDKCEQQTRFRTYERVRGMPDFVSWYHAAEKASHKASIDFEYPPRSTTVFLVYWWRSTLAITNAQRLTSVLDFVRSLQDTGMSAPMRQGDQIGRRKLDRVRNFAAGPDRLWCDDVAHHALSLPSDKRKIEFQ
ncbi:hypothetical protein DENSPDRAFT_852942 [Dentipellis sp. KUC8613]|nr:hypothetical protein DENSPDRAFT_852942 [Dentipellis sp. KUC8613]